MNLARFREIIQYVRKFTSQAYFEIFLIYLNADNSEKPDEYDAVEFVWIEDILDAKEALLLSIKFAKKSIDIPKGRSSCVKYFI